ncbi:MAG: T9SS type A sorting domain-containing protein, partial [Chitinispirillia bacterium]|nr:T9SS type A sorting domain-containing protein [Chitinispirillia bacterium]
RISVGVAADGVNVKYQWYVNTVAKNDGGLPIPGATAPFYEAPLGTLGVFHYYVVITANEEVVSFASLPASVSVVKPSAGWFDPQATRHTISTAEELAVLAAIVNGTAEGIEKYNFFGDTVTLAADIDLSGYAAGEGWMPIGWELWDYDVSYNDGFLGVFDGGGHIISNLTINRPNAKYQGLFGVIGQTSRVINLGLEKVSVTGKQFVGGVAGIARGYNGQGSSEIGQSLIRNSYSTGTVTGSYSVGGITGNAMAGRIYDSHFSGTVSGDSLVGGIVGSNGVILINNYSTGTVSGTGNYVGGIMGGGSGGVVENCYSTAAVSGANNVGGLVGMITTRGGTVINSAALNIEVKSAGTNVGRVVGMIGSGTEWSSRVEGNTAFNGITSIYQSAVWLNVGADKRDGADISVSDIRSDGTIGGLFLAENGWTAEDGKLPGIGAVVALPKHLGGDTPVKHTVSGQRSAQYVKLAGRSLNLRLAGKGSVSVFALNGARVRKVDLAKGSHTLRMNDLPRGVYMVRVHSGAWKQSVRMLVK